MLKLQTNLVKLETVITEASHKNSTRNKLDYSDRRFHDWYRFVLSFPPHLVRKYLNEFKLTKKDILLDPFCGTGTTLLEAKLNNIPSIGIEANPFAHFASSVKTEWHVNSDILYKTAKKIRDEAISRLADQGISDEPSAKNLKSKKLLTFSFEEKKLVLKDSLSPLPLHKALTLIDAINSYKKTGYYKYLALALANSAVFDFSNLRFGPEVGVGNIKEDAVVINAWFNQVTKIKNDLAYSVNIDREVPSTPFLSDSRNLKAALNGYKISAVITSPPYPNEKDYTRTTRLESVLLGFIKTREDLKKFKKTLLRSNTRGVYKEDNDDNYIHSFPEIRRLADEIETRRVELGKTSGFERLYHKVTKLYFGGIIRHLIELQSVLKPNAHLAYVVGDQASYLRVMIRTGHLIAEIAQTLGYELVRIDLFRTRFSTATKTNLNEEVIILRWPG